MNVIKNSPSLVDLSKYKLNPIFQKQEPSFLFKKKWSLNKIVLTAFIIFTIFFLYNCKYGIFKYPNPGLIAYTASTPASTPASTGA
jgi:hypothetical protein